MKSARVTNALLGNMIAESVYSEQGNMLLSKGMVINEHVLDKLTVHDIDYVYIYDALLEDVKPQGIIDEVKYKKSIATVKNVFNKVLSEETMGVTSSISSQALVAVQEIIDDLLETLENSEEILYTVVDLIGVDAYTYKHSVNVTVLSIIVARALGYKRSDIKNIALGALLHDIGKVRVNPELILKPDKLTMQERNLIEEHPKLGHDLLVGFDHIPYSTKQIILFHHEKLDGTGYPYGLKGIEIPEYVRIVTVCDMYDAMTTDRVYRSKMPFYRALDILMGEAIYRIDPKVYNALLDNVAVYPVGTGIILSDKRIGVVLKYRHKNPARPIVRVLNNGTDSDRILVETIDLEKSQILYIEDVWDIQTKQAEQQEKRMMQSQ